MMEKDRKPSTASILNLILDIIRLLTGEDYTIVKKKSSNIHRSHPVSSIVYEQDNDEKILELTNKIIQLLTGEVPIRCQDVSVYFSMEEWEYIEEHKGWYKDMMGENNPLFTSPDEFCSRKIPERCPCPLDFIYSQDHSEENDNIPEDYQCEDLFDIKVEVIDEDVETYVMADQIEEEEIPIEISTEWRRFPSSDEADSSLIVISYNTMDGIQTYIPAALVPPRETPT